VVCRGISAIFGVIVTENERSIGMVPLTRWTALAAIAAVALFAGCGDDGPSSDSTPVNVNGESQVELNAASEDATKDPAGPEVLGQLQELRQAENSQSVPAIRGSAGLAVPDWIHTVDGDVASYWQKQFNDAGYRYRPATEHIFNTRMQSACGEANPQTGPFYCPSDGGIYFPVAFFDKYSVPFGDAATAIVVAHENGHRIEDLLGEFNGTLTSAQVELQADCLAGVWAKTVYDRGLLEEGDIGEILGLVNISGDSPGTPVNAAGAHGNAQLRAKYFEQGYEGGQPGACPPPKRSAIRAGS
jgi:predicted metalloprotease